MSGGHFDYKYFDINNFAEELKHYNDIEAKSGVWNDKTITLLIGCQELIEQAGKLAREVEWLYSGDHGEESFAELIQKIKEEYK